MMSKLDSVAVFSIIPFCTIFSYPFLSFSRRVVLFRSFVCNFYNLLNFLCVLDNYCHEKVILVGDE